MDPMFHKGHTNLNACTGIQRKLIQGTSAVLNAYTLEPGFVVLVSYNEASLSVQIANKGTIYASATFSELGEAFVTRGSTENYFDTVTQAIQGWLAATSKTIPENDEYQESAIKALVLSGDASEAGFKDLKKVLSEIFAGAELKDGIEPVYVAAVGAARRGWQMVDNPIKYKLDRVQGHGEL